MPLSFTSTTASSSLHTNLSSSGFLGTQGCLGMSWLMKRQGKQRVGTVGGWRGWHQYPTRLQRLSYGALSKTHHQGMRGQGESSRQALLEGLPCREQKRSCWLA